MLLLDYSRWVVLGRIQGYQGLCFSQLSADGHRLIGISSPWDGTLIDLRLDKGIARKVFRFSRPSSVAVSPDSRFAYFETDPTGFFDAATLGCIDITTGRRVWWIKEGLTSDGVGAIACASGGRRVVASRKSDIHVWETADGSAKAYIADAHGGWVRSIVPLGDGTAVITSGDDGAMRVWDLDTLRELSAYQIEEVANRQVKWSVETRDGVKDGTTPID
jgi:WD40 repeat protein